MPTPAVRPTPPDRPAPSPAALHQLARLLDGLDQLDRLLTLPADPGAAGGVRFGRFLLRRQLGAGGYGVVFLADDPDLGRQVVVKVPQAATLTVPGFQDRFTREARAAARLDHPGIVPVYETGDVGGLAYLAAGYVPGPTLAAWLKDHPGPVPADEAARLVAALAAAVGHAHDRGVLHCDLTPANVLLAPGPPGHPPRPMVTDFGLARLLEDDPALTRTVLVAGTPLYMAPEQARGDRRALTARADVYALGAILYELLTGTPPFAAKSDVEVLARVLTDPPTRPRRLRPEVPADLEAICLKCLEKDPADRYPTAAALEEDLGRFLRNEVTAARPVGPARSAAKWVRRHPVRAAGAVVLAAGLTAAGVVAVAARNREVEHRAARQVAEAEHRAAEAAADAAEFAAGLERVRQRRLERPAGWPAANLADVRRLAGSAAAAASPDALRTEAAAALSAVTLGEPRVLAPGFLAYAPAYHPDGKVIALGSWFPTTPGTCEVRLLDPDTGALVRALTYPTDPAWEGRYGKPDTDGCRRLAFSPDGRWLVLGTRSGWLVRWDLAAADPRPVRWRLAADDSPVRFSHPTGLEFTETGRLLVASGEKAVVGYDTANGWAVAFRETLKGQHTSGVFRTARAGDGLCVASDGRLCRVAEHPPGVYPANVLTGSSMLAGPTAHLFATTAPDGRYGLFGLVTPGLGPHIQEAFTPLTLPGDNRPEDGGITDLAFSPDGTLLAVSAEHVGRVRLWDVLPGQPLEVRAVGIRGNGGSSLRLAFRPGGGELAVTTEDRTRVFPVARPGSATPLYVRPYPVDDAAVTPDGRVTATRADRPHAAEVDVWEPSAPAPVRIWPDVLHPTHRSARLVAVSPDGRTVVFTDEDRLIASTDPESPTARGHAPRTRTFVLGRPVVSYSVHSPGTQDLVYDPSGRVWVGGEKGVAWWLPGQPVDPVPAGAGPLVRMTTTGRPAESGQDTGLVWIGPPVRSLGVGRGMILAGLTDGSVARYAPDGTPGPVVRVSARPVSAVAAAPDGTSFLAGDTGGAVRMVRAAGGLVRELLPAHTDEVSAVAAGPGGWFATGSRDRTVKVWDPAGRLVLTLPQSRPVRRVFWSADGRSLTVLAEGERGLRRWHLDRLRAELAALGLDPGLP